MGNEMNDDVEASLPMAGKGAREGLGHRGERGARAMRAVVRAHVDEHLHLRPLLASLLEPTTWCIDTVDWQDETLEISGWAMAPANRYAPATFTLNGNPFEEIDYPRSRPDIGELFWFRPGAEFSGFVCRTSAVDRDRWSEGNAGLHFADARTLMPFRDDHGFYLIDPESDDLPLPEAERRIRVHGNGDLTSFRAQGSSAFVKLDRALQKTVGKAFHDFRQVLDWGCGCGRISRYLRSLEGGSLHGVDIDESNVEWCREHLPFSEFSSCRVDPPMPLDSDRFDLVFGISVMTHLREVDRQAWLAELARVCSDEAVVLLTVQGASALCRSTVGSSSLALWQQSGMIDVGVSSAANELSPEPDRYIDCFLTHEYIRDRWSEHFEIVEILPGYIGNVQDLVVLRKRSI